MIVDAATPEGERLGEIAVNFRSATAKETFELLCRADALTRREREVVAALVAGLDTRALAQRLQVRRGRPGRWAG